MKFILLNEGGRRGARIEGSNSVSLDANPLGRARLITAVAVAAGRASPEVRPADENQIVYGKSAPTITEALAQGELILLAEDNLTNRQVISRQLNKLGYACEIAEDGKLALTAWREKNYALLLTDCHMPNMDGYELATTIRDDEREGDTRAPIIAITANALQGEAERCIAAGMDDYLSKPVAMKDLLAKLHKWMPDALASTVPEASGSDTDTSKTQDKAADISGVLDPSFLRETFGDDDGLIREILQDYVQPAGDCIGEIVEAYDAHDGVALGQAAHKLKSSSRSVGADGLADLCQSLEQAGKADDWESVENTYPQLAPTLDAVITAINDF